jgi:hypothetical protein
MYGSWIYNYLSKQWLSLQISIRARCITLCASLNLQDVKKFDPRKSLAEKRKAEQQKKAEEAKKEGTPEKSDKPNVKISQKSIDRLSAPKQVKVKIEMPTKPEPTKTPNVSNLIIDLSRNVYKNTLKN